LVVVRRLISTGLESQNRPVGNCVMAVRRNLRVVKWIGSAHAMGICMYCETSFSVPPESLKRTSDAQASLHKQFTEHKCTRLDSSQNALRVVRESTEGK
jgi:hypothetical protein